MLELINLVNERVDELILADLIQNFAFFENNSAAVAACQADIGFLGFSRAVYNAAHNGDLDIFVTAAQAFLYLVRDFNEVNPRSAAGRAGNELHAVGM